MSEGDVILWFFLVVFVVVVFGIDVFLSCVFLEFYIF